MNCDELCVRVGVTEPVCDGDCVGDRVVERERVCVDDPVAICEGVTVELEERVVVGDSVGDGLDRWLPVAVPLLVCDCDLDGVGAEEGVVVGVPVGVGEGASGTNEIP